jgi:hypothetical protein
MNDDELWEFYNSISKFTREKYNLSPREKLQKTKSTGADLVAGLPANDLHCALLWHAVYKPFWNDKAANSGGPSWSWASLSQRVGWPDYSFSKRAEHVPSIQIVEIAPDRPDTLEIGSEEPGVVRKVKHNSTIVVVADICRAAYALHTEKIWEGTTLRKGYLTSLDLSRQVSCTMDADFSSREVWCTPVLKRRLSNGKWRTHFLVLEVSVDEHENEGDEMMPGATKTFRRVGTGKVNHEDKDLELIKMPERLKVVLA